MPFQNLISSSSSQKALQFLCEHMGKDFYDAEIARMIPDISRASANNALRFLYEIGITKRYFIGNIALNRVEPTTIFIREYRRFIYVSKMASFIEEVKSWADHMYIFGDYIEKPFGDEPIADIFIVSDKYDRIARIFRHHPYSKHLNNITYSLRQFEAFKNESPTSWEEIQKGLKLI